MFLYTLRGNKNVGWHFLIWITFVMYTYFLNLGSVEFSHVLAFCFAGVLVFYSLVYIGKQYCYTESRFVMAALWIGVSFLCFSVFTYFYVYLLLPKIGIHLFSKNHVFDIGQYVQRLLVEYSTFFKYALMYFLGRLTLVKGREKRRVEYDFLRAQINPHFLHNTLNTFSSQTRAYSGELADNIEKLSKVMRYSMESIKQGAGLVSVEKELLNMQAVIDIYSLSGDKHVDTHISGEQIGQKLLPHSLITLVENGFKHGYLKDFRFPLVIRVTLFPDGLNFYCRNKKKKKPLVRASSHAIGIENLRRRLDVDFKKAYELNIHEDEDFYTVDFQLKTK